MDGVNIFATKTVALLCPDNIIGKVLLRKLILLAGYLLHKIIIFDNHSRKEQLSPTKICELLIDSDPFFRGVPTELMKHVRNQKICVVTIPQSQEHRQSDPSDSPQ
jgi:hypothetical protein